MSSSPGIPVTAKQEDLFVPSVGIEDARVLVAANAAAWALHHPEDDSEQIYHISKEEAEVAMRIAKRVLEHVDEFDADSQYKDWLQRTNR